MKRIIIRNLLILSCICAMLLTGCGDTNNSTVPITDNSITTDSAIYYPSANNENGNTTSEKEVLEETLSHTDDLEMASPEEDKTEENDESISSFEDNIDSGNNTSSESTEGTIFGGNNSTSSSGSVAETTPTPATTHTHSYNATITTTANCIRTGIRTYSCSCGDAYTETIPVTAHTYSYGKCTVCNASDPSYVETYTYEVVLDTAMLGLVNARRTSLGYGSLTWDSGMDEVAKIRARQIADDFRHTYEYPYGELITCSGRYMTTSDCHTNYVNSSGHDYELHKNNYAYLSSATCYKKDSAGNVVATYNVVLLKSEAAPGSSYTPGNGEIDPNPPSVIID